jgi:hypothetical protein
MPTGMKNSGTLRWKIYEWSFCDRSNFQNSFWGHYFYAK